MTKIIYIYEKIYIFKNVIIRLTKHLPKDILAIRVVFIGSKFAWKRIGGSGSIRVEGTFELSHVNESENP